MEPTVLVLRTAGTNCDAETAHAFELVGARTRTLHINALRAEPTILREVQVLAIPGGFSYGDDIASGRVFANELMSALRDELLAFIDRGGYAIGICNGFQVLVKAGLLPRIDGKLEQQATLTHNISHLYMDRWVEVQGDPSLCAWIPDDQPIELPVAHAEGRFLAPASTIEALTASKQIALRYHTGHDFNGSAGNIAGICDPSGRVFGLMPHPERFLRWENHPRWTRLPRQQEGAGVRLFRAAIDHLKQN
jgi:phosphoribosylformylglycinamidine synthase I